MRGRIGVETQGRQPVASGLLFDEHSPPLEDVDLVDYARDQGYLQNLQGWSL